VLYSVHVDGQCEASAVRMQTVPAGNDPLGKVIAGTLVIKGLCLPARIENYMKQGADRSALNLLGKKDLIGLEWYRDHENNDLADQDLTAVLIASNEAHIYFVVLLLKDGQIYQRVGLAIWHSSCMRQSDIRFGMFDSTILERHNNNESWEGCTEYQEFTIIRMH
jgi:hypothetical protein